MINGSFPAMGTRVDVYAPDEAGLIATRDLFADIEQRCSRFRDDSELTAINRRTGYTVEISQMMRSILEIARELHRRTNGLVDPAVGSRVTDWGYDRTFEKVTDRSAPPEDRAIGSWELSGTSLCLYPGVTLDLGGIAKGWACDRAVEKGSALVVSAGGDVRSAHPEARAEILDGGDLPATTIEVGLGALATSSTARRRWMAGDRPAHHIIDPRTGNPAVSPVVSSSALAATAVEAEAAAKAALILGTEGLAWIDRQDWLRGGVAVWHDGSVFATGSVAVAA